VPVTLNPHGLEINGQTVPVYSGAVHYWRLERDMWPLILDQVQALGFQMLETYIPWSVHETAPGQFDWGQVDARKNLEAFLSLCEQRGLWLLVRPGPLINAELTDFGFPEWVLLDPAVQARTSLGSLHYDAAYGLHPPHQFPVPSYASEAFYTAVGGWFDAVCPLLARHLAPAGCVVAVQSDNETCYLFHDQAYATDYSDSSLALYRAFLQAHYGTLDALNAAYGAAYAHWPAVEPPRDCEVQTRADLPRHLDWVRYKEYQIHWSLVRLARMLRARGLQGVPIFHDVAYQYDTPLDVPALEADPELDWVGMNLYRNREDYAGGMTRIRYLAGVTRLPFVPEFGAGLWSHHTATFLPAEHEFITLGALMHGLKAFNFYMLVERERWTGSPITRHGALRPDYAPFYQQLNAFLRRYRFWEFEKQRQVLVLFNYDAGRYAALASTLHYGHVDLLGLPPELGQVDLDLGLRWDARLEAGRQPGSWLSAALGWLEAQHVAYDQGDTHLSAAQLGRYPLVLLPAVDFLDPAAQRELLAYVRAGGHLLLGPGLPYLDPSLQGCYLLSDNLAQPGTVRLGAGQLTWVGTAGVAAALAAAAPPPDVRCDQPALDLVLHRRDGCALLFAANPTAGELTATLSADRPLRLTPAWGGPLPEPAPGGVRVVLPAYSVGIWEAAHA